MKTIKELQNLREELTRHDYRYYILSNPTISDQEYDKMYMEWQDFCGTDTRSLETENLYPEWVKEELANEKRMI